MELAPYLKELGLDEKEIAVYSASLELGESSIMPITRRVHLPRSTTYYVLEKLANAGIISIIPGSTRRLYTPSTPRQLLILLKKRRAEMDRQINSLDIALPEFSEKYGLSRFQPKVRFYQGQAEIRSLYDSILDAPVNELLYVSEIRKIDQVLGHEWLSDWLDRRITSGMRTKAVWVKSEAILDDPLYRPGRQTLRTVRYAPAGFTTPAHILIYGDSVAMITTAEEDSALLISSRDIAASMRNMFKELWKVSTDK